MIRVRPRIAILAMLVSLLAMSQVMAEWKASKDPLGPGWLVSNGDKTVRAKNKKNAEKKAKLLNKNASEFKAEASGPCADPTSGVRC